MSSRTLQCLSADYRSAPLPLLERLTLDEGSMHSFIGRLIRSLRATDPAAEVVVLNTCNRFEVYWSEGSPADICRSLVEQSHTDFDGPRLADIRADRAQAAVLSRIAAASGASEAELAGSFTVLRGESAASHLFRVCSGLESLVIGEHQILGQVEQAFGFSKRAGGSGRVMTVLQNVAVRCGRRARRESDISRNPRDVSTVAIQLSEKLVGKLDKRRVLVAGAGEIGRLVAKSLSHRKVERVDVVNRSIDAAREVAERWGGAAHGMEKIGELLGDADVVFATTSAREPILTEPTIRDVMKRRAERPLVLIDLAVPRDIEPGAGEVDGVHLFDLEGLKEIAEAGEAERREAIPAVEAIIREEIGKLHAEFGELAVRPVLAELWKGAEETRRSVLLDARSRLEELSEEQWSEIERMTELLTKKLLHGPSTRLRTKPSNGLYLKYAGLIAHLFGLSREPGEG